MESIALIDPVTGFECKTPSFALLFSQEPVTHGPRVKVVPRNLPCWVDAQGESTLSRASLVRARNVESSEVAIASAQESVFNARVRAVISHDLPRRIDGSRECAPCGARSV